MVELTSNTVVLDKQHLTFFWISIGQLSTLANSRFQFGHAVYRISERNLFVEYFQLLGTGTMHVELAAL